MSCTNLKIYIDKQNTQRNSQGNSYVKSRISSDENKSGITFLIFIIIFFLVKEKDKKERLQLIRFYILKKLLTV